jgi:hypothetical protein
MMDSGPITSVIGYVGPLCMAATLILGVWYRVEGKIDKAKAAADEAAASAAEKAHDVEKQLSDFKLKVAEEYASWDTVRAIEARLTERMDNLADTVSKMPDAVLDRITKYLTLKPT